MTENGKTIQIAACAGGCAYHSTVGGTCGMCQGPLTEPQAVTREQARAILLGGERYDEGKAAVLRGLLRCEAVNAALLDQADDAR